MSKELVSGLIVDVECPYQEPSRIILYKLGTSGATWLTPDEAERLCEALKRKIAAARKGQ